jgi:N-methylhydantoinase A/oxoprolinase/acetone carboxylase beta subunit
MGPSTPRNSSSVDNYARAIVGGLIELFEETGLVGRAIEEILHGTTVASNAILEHKGARVGLITTKGFRDVLEIRTSRMPRLYDPRTGFASRPRKNCAASCLTRSAAMMWRYPEFMALTSGELRNNSEIRP